MSAPGRAGDIARRLLAWFEGRDRDVPWRDAEDPYRIWVAEVMAQQTRIETVRDYWDGFLARFPDVESLAAADLDDVLKAWEGLGYYARARNLHRAARLVVERHGGELPRTAEGLRGLPGIGPYTAGAVASLAFGAVEPAVDGNARRVLARLHDVAEPSPGALHGHARRLLEAAPAAAGTLNQALMDLGSDVCTPRAPACTACPLRDACLAWARDTVDERPRARRRRAVPHHDVAAAVVWSGRRILIQRRPPEGLLGGLWEFPGGKVEEDETPAEAAAREVLEELGIRIRVRRPIARVDHAYSHFRITLHAFHARHLEGEPEPTSATAWLWTSPDRLEEYAFPAANQRIIAALRDDAAAAGREVPLPGSPPAPPGGSP